MNKDFQNKAFTQDQIKKIGNSIIYFSTKIAEREIKKDLLCGFCFISGFFRAKFLLIKFVALIITVKRKNIFQIMGVDLVLITDFTVYNSGSS